MPGSDRSKDARSESSAAASDKDRVNRRQAIRVVATGSVVAGSLLLPKQWTKPLVETVVSPAAGQVFSPIICMSNGQTGVLCCPVSAPPYCQVDNSCISDPFCELS